jgi:antagonist of KipI
MSTDTLKIVSPGMLTSVQDLGRRGYQRFGIPVSGAMDAPALRVANILVGNRENAAGLEATVMGPTIRILTDTTIALAGADLGASLDGNPIPSWQSVTAPAGSTLSFGSPKDGIRGYIAVAGGIDVPMLMGSRSTYMKGGFGGYQGRAILAGDIIKTLKPRVELNSNGITLPAELMPFEYGHNHNVKVVMGPQDDAFSLESKTAFLSSEYGISVQSDRMGYRMEGPAVKHLVGADIISDATALGSVQIPGDGNPIILMADRGTTGGYTKIATVVGPDLSLLAQSMPGDKVRFTSVTPAEAREILMEQENFIADIKKVVGLDFSGLFTLATDGNGHNVLSEDGDRITGFNNSSGQSRTVQAKAAGFDFGIDIRYS